MTKSNKAVGIGRLCILALSAAPIAPGMTLSAQVGSAVDQSTSARPALRLEELYATAARHSPRIEASTALARAADARISSATKPPDPQLQLGFMNRSLPSLAPMVPLGMTQIQIMQMIPTPGKLGLAGKVASLQASAARARSEDIRWDVRSRVAMAFYDLYRVDRSLIVAQQTRRLLQDIAKTAQSMYAVGDGRQADVLRAQVEVARMDEEIIRMGAMRSAMSGRLGSVLDAGPDTVFGSPVLPAMPDTLPPLNTLITAAQAGRPMVIAGSRDVDAAVATEALSRKEIWPDLQVGVQYGQNRGSMGIERMGSLMLGASIPIFAGSRQLRMREEADAMRTMASAELRAMRAETSARITEVYADFQRARNLRSLYRTTVIPQAEGAVSASLAAYRVGTVNLMTLLDNQMTVNSYRQQVFELEAEQGKAIAEIEMLLGKALFDPALIARGSNNDR